MPEPQQHYFIGLPEWRHPNWYAEGRNPKEPLKIYSRHFSSVEGNTTFYALPSQDKVQTWNDLVPKSFKFCFKFPKAITHDAALRHCALPVNEFLGRLSPLEHKLGILWLQMSPSFTPQQLPDLDHFLTKLPTDFNYGVEVRHPGFFAKDDKEKNFHQLLHKYRVNRVMFDTRVLFAHPANDEASKKAWKEKPHQPLHVITTGDNPMLRFMSPMNLDLSEAALDQWASKILQWIDEGKTPYLFFHTPDKSPVASLARRFSEKITALRPKISPITLWNEPPQQASLF